MSVLQIASDIARGFSVSYWWKTYQKSLSGVALKKLYYTFKYMRLASKNGGYCGRSTIIKSKPDMPHGFHGVHISRYAVIGEQATIFQNVTITSGVTIGNNCFIGAGAILVGPISIGNNVRIGGGRLFLKMFLIIVQWLDKNQG